MVKLKKVTLSLNSRLSVKTTSFFLTFLNSEVKYKYLIPRKLSFVLRPYRGVARVMWRPGDMTQNLRPSHPFPPSDVATGDGVGPTPPPSTYVQTPPWD